MIVRQAERKDAANILEYLKVVGGETDYLLFGEEGLEHVSVEAEGDAIENFNNGGNSVMLLAMDGDTIAGMASLGANRRERIMHQVSMAISVRKDYWGKGAGRLLMEGLIDYAKHRPIEIITLEVFDDNVRGIKLYEKYGFEKIGYFKNFAKVNGHYKHALLMNLYLDEER